MLLMIVIVMIMVMVVMVVMVMMIMSASTSALVVIIVMMVMMLLKLSLCLCHQLFHHRIRLLDQFQKLCTAELFYRGCHDRRVRVLLTKHLYICLYLLCICNIGTAQNDRSGILNLVVEELTEVLHVHLALASIYNRNGAVQLHFQILGNVTNCVHDVRQLAYT